MKLPIWIPKVNKPWNPGYSHIWNAMSDNEKRWSFLIDALVVIFALTILIIAR